MISSLSGAVVKLAATSVVVDVVGVGIHAYASPSTLATLRIGQPARLVTRLISREDSLTLYAFSSSQEREVFDALITINGVGPKLALAVLSTLGPDTVRQAAAQADGKTFTTVPGVGPKVANRIVLELAGKLPPPDTGASPPRADHRAEDVAEALVSLGWSEKEAKTRVKAAFAADPEISDLADTGSMLRAVLTWLGRDTTRTSATTGS